MIFATRLFIDKLFNTSSKQTIVIIILIFGSPKKAHQSVAMPLFHMLSKCMGKNESIYIQCQHLSKLHVIVSLGRFVNFGFFVSQSTNYLHSSQILVQTCYQLGSMFVNGFSMYHIYLHAQYAVEHYSNVKDENMKKIYWPFLAQSFSQHSVEYSYMVCD